MNTRKLPLAPLLLGGFCLLLLTVFFGIWLVRKEEAIGEQTTVDSEKIRLLIDTLPTDQATGITVSNAGQQIRLTRVGSDWSIAGDPDTPIHQEIVVSLLEQIRVLTALREIGRGNLPEYGLDNPGTVLTLDCGSESYSLCFGNFNGAYNGYYFVLDGSDWVYLVEQTLYAHSALTLDDLLKLPELPDLSDVAALTLTLPDGRIQSIEPGGANAAEAGLIRCLSSLSISHRVDYGHDSDKLYGLDRPLTAQIQIGDAILNLQFGVGESDRYIYLRIGNSPAVYVIDAENPDALLAYLG